MSFKGECNNCGICCNTDAWFLKEKDIAKWFSLRGFKRPIGVEEITHVIVKKVDADTIKLVFFSHCENAETVTLPSGKEITKCKDYENRPIRCDAFPWSAESCKCIPECSYNENGYYEKDLDQEEGEIIEKSIEHLAWELLIERIGYLNGFAGNRSTMGQMNKEIELSLQKAKKMRGEK